MLSKLQNYIILIIIAGAINWQCRKDVPTFDAIPHIELLSLQQLKHKGKDSLVSVQLSYTDGDGDIGLNTEDTLAPYNYGGPFYNNLIIKIYKIENGTTMPLIEPSSGDTLNFNDRITNLTPTGKNKSIQGVITIPLNAIPYPGILPDSMQYSIQLYDRALNKSNLIITKPLAFTF